MLTVYLKLDRSECLTISDKCIARSRVLIEADILCCVITSLGKSESSISASYGIGKELSVLNISVNNEKTALILRKSKYKSPEAVPYIIYVLKEIKMICLNIKNYGNCRVETQKAVGIFTGLRNKVIPCSVSQIAADSIKQAAHAYRRILLCLDQYLTEH